MNNIINLINSGEIDHYDLLLSMDEQISRSKEEASSRKAIMEKVEKWKLACDEERWLEEYSRVDNIGTNEAKENGSSNEQAIWLVAAR
ncbi:hypothetical protein AAZX31_18G132500 [Glycine max]|nr:hypothetical protein JHK82_050377 [Glycine max]